MIHQWAIATHSLTKQFDRQLAVRDVDLQIAAGDVYGLIGPNGAGKTTLIRLLAGVEEPTIGEILIDGDPLRFDQPNFLLKRRIGYLPDDFPLYDDLHVWDYLDYFARLYDLSDPRRSQRLWEILELVDLTSKRQAPIHTLSRGMKQRLGLARTLIHEPIILLLDEPVSGLDPLARQQFRQIIKVLQSAGMTILISSHVLSDLAELCTSVGIMELGHLVESTRLRDLYQRLARQQLLISCLGDPATLHTYLLNYPQVEGLQINPLGQIQVDFTGDELACAELLKALVMAGIPVSHFQRTQEDLETIFLKLDHQQVG
ncbi:MAG: ABC transporter ATP-binding protein [Cyanobacteriota bacterium]|nr:ABC transporter ATP-binding protein [Cyanobacteriota bacterium]